MIVFTGKKVPLVINRELSTNSAVSSQVEREQHSAHWFVFESTASLIFRLLT